MKKLNLTFVCIIALVVAFTLAAAIFEFGSEVLWFLALPILISGVAIWRAVVYFKLPRTRKFEPKFFFKLSSLVFSGVLLMTSVVGMLEPIFLSSVANRWGGVLFYASALLVLLCEGIAWIMSGTDAVKKLTVINAVFLLIVALTLIAVTVITVREAILESQREGDDIFGSQPMFVSILCIIFSAPLFFAEIVIWRSVLYFATPRTRRFEPKFFFKLASLLLSAVILLAWAISAIATLAFVTFDGLLFLFQFYVMIAVVLCELVSVFVGFLRVRYRPTDANCEEKTKISEEL